MIARARPDAGPVAAELLARLLGDLGDAAGPHVYLHGDANLRNAIFDDERVTLIDFEDASAGPRPPTSARCSPACVSRA